jgi:hypothetical protein
MVSENDDGHTCASRSICRQDFAGDKLFVFWLQFIWVVVDV